MRDREPVGRGYAVATMTGCCASTCVAVELEAPGGKCDVDMMIVLGGLLDWKAATEIAILRCQDGETPMIF